MARGKQAKAAKQIEKNLLVKLTHIYDLKKDTQKPCEYDHYSLEAIHRLKAANSQYQWFGKKIDEILNLPIVAELECSQTTVEENAELKAPSSTVQNSSILQITMFKNEESEVEVATGIKSNGDSDDESEDGDWCMIPRSNQCI